jgi:hypothetical protein
MIITSDMMEMLLVKGAVNPSEHGNTRIRDFVHRAEGAGSLEGSLPMESGSRAGTKHARRCATELYPAGQPVRWLDVENRI